MAQTRFTLEQRTRHGREVYVVVDALLARLAGFAKEADAAYAVRYANDHPEWAINLMWDDQDTAAPRDGRVR